MTLNTRIASAKDFGSFDDLYSQAKKKMKLSSGSTTTTADSTNSVGR